MWTILLIHLAYLVGFFLGGYEEGDRAMFEFILSIVIVVGTLRVGYAFGRKKGDLDGYVRGYRDGIHGRTLKRVREGGAY